MKEAHFSSVCHWQAEPLQKEAQRTGFGIAALCLVCLLVCGCSRKRVQATSPVEALGTATLEETVGRASWYGHPYHGRRTSNGETYDMNTMTAAHRTLPFDTIVRVNCLENGKNVTVRINDRGPFVEDRIIDLSYAAAKAIDMVRPGTARVRLEVLKTVKNPFPLAIQVGAFREEKNARLLRAKLQSRFSPILITKYERENGIVYRVLAGRYSINEEAQTALRDLRALGYSGILVRLDS